MPEFKIEVKITREFTFTVDAEDKEEAREIVENTYPVSHFSGGETCLVGINSSDVDGNCTEIEVTDEGEFKITSVEETN